VNGLSFTPLWFIDDHWRLAADALILGLTSLTGILLMVGLTLFGRYRAGRDDDRER